MLMMWQPATVGLLPTTKSQMYSALSTTSEHQEDRSLGGISFENFIW
jgi:hypothetical protein